MMSDFSFKSLQDLSNGLDRKVFSATELLEAVIARHANLEPRLNMFCHVDFDAARVSAQATDDRIRRGARIGVLDGIPTSIKDLIAVRDMPQRFGSRSVSDAAVTQDAPSVERLRQAGAVILGKSTTSEFGCKGVGDSPLTGITRNPWNPDKTPGGSSCGAAAMVAAGLVPYAIGTDGGGSIRIPASLCGLFGIKAQFGRVPVFPTSATPTLAHVGPLARNVEDAATVLLVIAGYDRRDPATVLGPLGDLDAAGRNPRRFRIAWSPTLGYGRVDPEVQQITANAVATIAGLGVDVELVDHVMDDPVDLWAAEFYAGVGTKLRHVLQDAPETLDPAVLEVLKIAISQDMDSYYRKVFERYAFREKMRQFFESYDLLLTPTLPVPAFDVGHDVPPGFEDKSIVSWATFTYPFNLTGQPAASLPVGTTRDGLPVGLQIVAPCHDEAAIFSLAARYQNATSEAGDMRPAL
jgi:aspartyl-tRNA(Asn)/glutamyl-tRNA(Gln) amidotransferase subunit A